MDAAGKTVFHSGFDESAHVYKQIILDEQARPITRHQIWLTNIKAYDNTIPPGRSDIACFRLPALSGAVTLRARVNYRRLNQEYTSYVAVTRATEALEITWEPKNDKSDDPSNKVLVRLGKEPAITVNGYI